MLEQRVEFWRTLLVHASDVESADHARGRPSDGCPQIPRTLTNETRELARRTGVTLFSALLGAFQIAFSEWSGYDDLVVGTPVANRTKQTRAGNNGILRGYRTLARAARSLARGGRSFASGHQTND